MNLKELLEYKLLIINDFSITIASILGIILIFVVAKLLVYLIRRILKKSQFIKSHLDPGRKFAIEQFIKYIIYTIAMMMVFENAGINLSIIWAGSAALLVGVGLGLQHTFNDLTSGVILLMEGDILKCSKILVQVYILVILENPH
jgi:small-conductance mechanosensitive channel